ncbi:MULTISPECIES: dicarboxylate/amino acid:cation symporter [Flammeovirga]|uniref:Dicarboxylate/amino acid:cation symporter n=1 Tax=Flammeovirga agarivorans TaxID=2726742 RepID=A0A7X8SLW1_9BACT|nr:MULTISPECIES: dicarboxylate/amino acid:cation symporter [Flammeovirga]NLR92527.1 dicarboxylate/amino acid:cation symporter [Flammeovirga agarivorans]
MKKLALHWKIIIGMVLGLFLGLSLSYAGLAQFSSDWIKPFGTIFIRLLKLIAVPLVLISLVNGVSSMTDLSKLSKMGGRAVGIYLTTTIIAVSIGLVLVNLFQPGAGFSNELRETFLTKFADTASSKTQMALAVQQRSPLQPLLDMVPGNIFNAMSSNSNMLQVIFFAILFSIALVAIPSEHGKAVKNLFNSLDKVILKMVDLIMLFAPYGVFALITSLITDFTGDDPSKASQLLIALGFYSLVVVMGLTIMITVVYPTILKVFAKVNFSTFIRGIFPAQMMAFSTSSSAAALPVTMKQVEEELGVSEETTSFVLPLGATINMDGTCLYQGVAAVFIAQVFGIDLTLGEQLSIVITATLASIGAAAVPGAGIIMLIIVLEQVGLPSEGIALILAPDRILDMFRTVVNVTGDASVAILVDRSVGNKPKIEETAE